MATWPDPRSISVGFAFGHTQYEDPTALSYDTVSPGDDPDTGDDPGPVLERVRISRGRLGDSPETQPTRVELSLRNEGGIFSPRNVTGAHYGQLGQGLPVEVAVDLGSGPQVLARAATEGRPTPSWVGPDMDEQIHITALGLMNRLSRDTDLTSALKRVILATNPVDYWPLEEGAGSTRAGTSITALAELTFTDAQADGSAGALDLVAPAPVTAAIARVTLPSVTEFQVEFLAVSDQAALTLMLQIQATTDLLSINTGLTAASADGLPHYRAVSFTQNGADVDVDFYIDGVLSSSSTSPSTTIKSTIDIDIVAGSFSSGDVTLSHLSVHSAVSDSADRVPAVDGYAGEEARDRVERVATEAQIPQNIPAADSSAMGGATPATDYRTMRDAESADEGVLFELRDGRLTYQARESRYNLDPALVLAFDDQVSDLFPIDDDRDTYNLITVSQPSGTFAVAEQTDGPVGSDTSTGIGPRPLPVTRNLYTADQLQNHAGYLLNRGTVDQPRYVVVLDLFAQPDLASDWLACDIGSRITISGAPADHVGPDDLDLIIEGSAETIDASQWRVEIYCEPYKPYLVGEYQDTATEGDVSRYDTAGCETASGMWLPTGWSGDVSTPDNSALDITTDLDLRADITPESWANGATQTLLAKYGTGTQRSYGLRITATGLLSLLYSTDGTADTSVSSTEAVAIHRTRLAVRATIDVNNGAGGRTVTFYTGTSTGDLGTVSWTQLGSTVITAGTVTIFSGNEPLEVGDRGASAQPFIGIIHAIQVRNGIDGTVVANPEFEDELTGDTSFTDSAGRVWTLTGDPAIYHDFVSGTDTELLVSTSTLGGPPWTQSASDLPMLLRVSGATLEITAVTGTGKPQLLTVTQAAVNGVAKTVAPGESISLAHSAIYAL